MDLTVREESSLAPALDCFGELIWPNEIPKAVIHYTPEELGIPRVVMEAPRPRVISVDPHWDENSRRRVRTQTDRSRKSLSRYSAITGERQGSEVRDQVLGKSDRVEALIRKVDRAALRVGKMLGRKPRGARNGGQLSVVSGQAMEIEKGTQEMGKRISEEIRATVLAADLSISNCALAKELGISDVTVLAIRRKAGLRSTATHGPYGPA
jgi:hypothetical protein